MASQIVTYGFQRGEDEANVYIDGAASCSLKVDFKRAVNDLNLAIKARISTKNDNSKFQAFSAKNIVNRLTTRGIQLEQSFESRRFHREIARAVASVFVSRLRFLVCIFIGRFEQAFPRPP